MSKLLCLLLLCQIFIPLALSQFLKPFKGQCPKMIPLSYDLSSERFAGSWYQYAVFPDYLQDKCIKREFAGIRYWLQFAHTDGENFIVQYFCHERRKNGIGRQHIKSISIFVRDPEASPEAVALIENALKRNFKFSLRDLNHTDYSFCTEIESQPAMVRA